MNLRKYIVTLAAAVTAAVFFSGCGDGTPVPRWQLLAMRSINLPRMIFGQPAAMWLNRKIGFVYGSRVLGGLLTKAIGNGDGFRNCLTKTNGKGADEYDFI